MKIDDEKLLSVAAAQSDEEPGAPNSRPVPNNASITHAPLIKAEPNPRLVKFYDGLGGVLTGLAMVPQGVFGGLLTYKFAKEKDWPEAAALIMLAVFGAASFEGKRRLVRYYNTNDFKNLATLEIKDFDPRRFSGSELIIGAINSYAIYVASKTFAGLAFIGLQDVSKLILRDYFHWDRAASVVEHWAFGAPFAAAAFLANLFAFRAIHKYGTGLLISFIEYLLENPAYRRERKMLEQHIERYRVLLRDCAEQKDWEGYTRIIRYILPEATLENPESLRLKSIARNDLRTAIVRAQVEGYSPQSCPTYLLQHLLAAICSGVSICGLLNFPEMTRRTNDYLHMSATSLWESWLDYASMGLLALNAVYPSIAGWFDRQRGLNFASLWRYTWNITLTILACVLGGMPNSYQSILANENVLLVVLASVASALIEASGFYNLTNDKTHEAICAEEGPFEEVAPRKVALENDRDLWELADLARLEEQELYELVNIRERSLTAEPASAVAVPVAEGEQTEGEEKKAARPDKWRRGCTPFWHHRETATAYVPLPDPPVAVAAPAGVARFDP